jgi:hypothetical protein
MSLLSICTTALTEIGLPALPTIIGNTDAQAVQTLALANRAGKEMAGDPRSAGYWQQLRKQYTFQTSGVGPYTCTVTPGSTTLTNLSSTVGITVGQNVYSTGLVNDTLVVPPGVVGTSVSISQAPTATIALSGQSVTFATESYALPSDLGHLIVQTEWDRNFRWQLLGPLDAQEWQVIKSGISPVGPRMRFRIMQGQFYINPVGSSSTLFIDTIAYEYVSSWWTALAGAPTVGASNTWQNDTDVSLISEDLMVMSLKWRFLKAKGLDWEKEEKDYMVKFDRIAGRAASARNLPLNARASGMRLLNSQNVPDSGFGT